MVKPGGWVTRWTRTGGGGKQPDDQAAVGGECSGEGGVGLHVGFGRTIGSETESQLQNRTAT